MAQKMLGVNPWLSIWVKPRETIRKIVKFNPRYRFVILSFLYGFPMLLHMAQNFSLGGKYTIAGIVIVALILATFVGMLAIVIAAALLHWTGRWIGGTADYLSVRAAVSWSNVPNIVGIIIWGVLVYFFKDQAFMDNFNEKNFVGRELYIFSGTLFLQAVVAIWSFVILVKCLGEVQGFSAWKGVLNVLIPFFMIGIFIWLLSWLYWVGSGITGASFLNVS